jgi:hypothetical protein
MARISVDDVIAKIRLIVLEKSKSAAEAPRKD